MTERAVHILGISAFYHDSAACLLLDGEIVAAAQEERFTRTKGDASFPERAIAACLAEGGLTPADLDEVVFYDKPFLKLERLLETYLATAPRGLPSYLKAAPVWMKDRLRIGSQIREGVARAGGRSEPWDGSLRWARHHESHAASAFFPSPFERAAILTLDGVGEWATATIGRGEGADIRLLRELRWPDSVGLLYSAFTYYTGFRVNEGEYKVMGLAPYGEPRFVDVILDDLIDLRDDGSFTMDPAFFRYATGLRMTSPRFDRLFGGPPRHEAAPLTQREMDLAASVQHVVEEIVLRMARTARDLTGEAALCMAGGVALNAVANGNLLRSGIFDEIWIQPAAGDAGGALGAALLAWHRARGGARTVRPDDGMGGALLGPAIQDDDAERVLRGLGAVFERPNDGALDRRVAHLLDDGKVVGCARNRMEFGPRALGSRSILGDPRDPAMQSVLNRKIKFRESFRPFAPAVLENHASEHFDLDRSTPYMTVVSPVRGVLSPLPAVTHVDGSARVQTLSAHRHPDLHRFTSAFHARTGCPVLINTSFNVKDEPIVADAFDAYRCFMRTDMDALVLGPFLLRKDDQPPWVEPEEPRPEAPPYRAGQGRKFAFTLAAAFAALCAVFVMLDRSPTLVRGAGGIAGLLAAAALLIPARLGPVERAWTRFGLLLSKVTTPVLLTASWVLVITPIGFVLRLFGHRPLDHGAQGASAWYDVDPPTADDRTMENQF